MRILIADDSRVERWRLRQILESAGHEVVHESPNGIDALHAIRELKPDLAILDVVMPQMTGDQTALELAADERPKLIFASKNSQPALKEIVASVGAKLCVKPYTPQKLLATVEACRGEC